MLFFLRCCRRCGHFYKMDRCPVPREKPGAKALMIDSNIPGSIMSDELQSTAELWSF